ncbi:MAG: hypothetical protein R3F11_20965 [Verrucomicrobiales bacterium]
MSPGAADAHGSVRAAARADRRATGAGDAFAAGLLLGAHEGEPPLPVPGIRRLRAAASLADPTPSEAC